MKKTEKRKAGQWRSAFLMAIVLMVALAGARVARSRVEPKRAEGAVAYAATRSGQDPNAIKPVLETARGLVESLKKKNLFVKAPPKQHPVSQVDGILGNEVLIGDKWYKAGDKIGDANIVSVEPTQITVQWNGQTKTFAPLASPEKGRPSPPEPEMKKPEKKVAAPKVDEPAEEPEQAVEQVVEVVDDEDPFGWMGVELSPKAREKLAEIWGSLSDEDKARARKEWDNMSQEQKEEGLKQLENM